MYSDENIDNVLAGQDLIGEGQRLAQSSGRAQATRAPPPRKRASRPPGAPSRLAKLTTAVRHRRDRVIRPPGTSPFTETVTAITPVEFAGSAKGLVTFPYPFAVFTPRGSVMFTAA